MSARPRRRRRRDTPPRDVGDRRLFRRSSRPSSTRWDGAGRGARIGSGMDVLDAAAGTGDASLPAAAPAPLVTASELTPELLDAGRRRAEAGAGAPSAEADAEKPASRTGLDVMISVIGAMLVLNYEVIADELVRV